MIAIGLAGPSKAGKSTLAKELARYGFRVSSFAGALRHEVYEAFVGKLDNDAVARLFKMVFHRDSPEKELVRPLFQAWGTLRRELCGEDYWVDQLHRAIKDWSLVVIDDVRYTNEAAYIKTRLKGIVVTLLPAEPPDSGVHRSELEYADIPADLELPRLPPSVQADLIMGFLKTQPRRAFSCKVISPRDSVEGIIVFDQQSAWKIYTRDAGSEAHAFGERIGNSFDEILLAANTPVTLGEYHLTHPKSIAISAGSPSAVLAYAKSELGHDAVD